ncbi:UDP-glucose 4-epimerase [Bacillus sp. ZZV12-4809]|nr:UDP-glucose 4-epimerase [Bacillus sp. ZZV12-4809]
MKKILITGTNSYIGTSFEEWVSQYPDKYNVDKVSLRDETWKSWSFKGYDVVFHTAAIVHRKENDIDKYFKINRDLTIDVAKKAKREGVKQFIFLSTMGVYGTETGYITKETLPKPKTPYAQSKFEAEQLLLEIKSQDFNVAILRPPIVYGKGCPGNYSRLSNFALKLPFIPHFENERSMIYINNLSEFVRLLVDKELSGICFPQNKDYVNTTELIGQIAKIHGKKVIKSKLFNGVIEIGLKHSEIFRKVFGSFIYDKELFGGPLSFINHEQIDYETMFFVESIRYTEKSSL